MKLPHFIKYNPRIASLGGHNGITLGFWTFTNIPRVSKEFVRHEYRHVQQQVLFTALGAVVIGVVCVLLSWSLWLLWLSPLGFALPYFLSSLIDGYEGNLFEKDARLYAVSRDD